MARVSLRRQILAGPWLFHGYGLLVSDGLKTACISSHRLHGVNYCTALYSTSQLSLIEMPCDAVRCSAMRCGVLCCALLCSAVLCSRRCGKFKAQIANIGVDGRRRPRGAGASLLNSQAPRKHKLLLPARLDPKSVSRLGGRKDRGTMSSKDHWHLHAPILC